MSITTFQITSTAGGTNLPFGPIGIGFRKGDIASGSVPNLDIANYQVTVKRTWNDGSVKHAIVAGRKTVTANIASILTVTSGSDPGGTALTSSSISTAAPSASIQCGSIGTVNLSSLLASPFRTWISGPEMVECHYTAAVGSDATLRVWFYVRLYADSTLWVRAIVENGYVDVSTSDKSYVPTITINGSTVYNNGGSTLSHYAHTRYMAEGWIGSNPGLTWKLDPTYLMSTKLVPNYWKRNPSATVLNSLTQTYTPMGRGDIAAQMWSSGYHAYLGILPQWDALYVTSGDSRALKSSFANASSLNSYPILWRDSSTKLPAKPSDYSTYEGINAYLISAGSLDWEMNHEPSEGYLSYLVSGDYWYYETMLLQVSLDYLALNNSRGNGTSRLLTAETRGTAWNLRNMTQLAGIFPSGDAVATEYQTLLSNNIDHWKTVKDGLGGTGIGYLWEYDVTIYGTNGEIAPWQQHFGIQSVGAGSDLEPLAGMTNYNIVRDWLYRAAVGIAGDSSGYCYNHAESFNIRISSGTSTDPSTFYADWATVYTQSVSAGFVPSGSCSTTLAGTSGGDPTIANIGYWGNFIPCLALAVEHGASGAGVAWARLIAATNWSAVETSGFDDIPIWGIVPRNSQGLPFDLAVGEWWKSTVQTGSKISDVYPTNPGGSQASIIDAWAGAAFDSSRKDILICNGGHNDYAGNEVYAFSVDRNSANFLKWRRKSFPSTRTDGTNIEAYSDDTPSARHTYCSIVYDPTHDDMILFAGAITWGNPPAGTVRTYAFDCVTETPNSTAPSAWVQKNTPSSWPQSSSPTPDVVYDSAADRFSMFANSGMTTYDASADAWTNRTSFDAINAPFNYTVVYVPGSPALILLIGDTFTQARRLDTFAGVGTSDADWGMTGDTVIKDPSAPGILYSANSGKVYGWAGLLTGGTDRRDYYEIDTSTKVSTRKVGTGDVPSAPNSNGTYTRFVEVGDGLTAVINSTTDEVYFLRVAAGTPSSSSATRRLILVLN